MGKPLPPSFSSALSPRRPGCSSLAARRPLPPAEPLQLGSSPGPCAAAGMGTPLAAPGLLLLLAGTAGLCRAFFSLPLRVSRPAAPSGSLPAPVVLRPASSSRQPDLRGGADGLALASDPGGTLNLLAMVENLQGDSGRGYYLEMLIGTPPQAVRAGRELRVLGGGLGGEANFSSVGRSPAPPSAQTQLSSFAQCWRLPFLPTPNDGAYAQRRRRQRMSFGTGGRLVSGCPPGRGPVTAGEILRGWCPVSGCVCLIAVWFEASCSVGRNGWGLESEGAFLILSFFKLRCIVIRCSERSSRENHSKSFC